MKTNLLMIIAHDLGVFNSAYGSGVKTPALERFSETAATFTNAYAVAPTCSPSRSAMMTGLYPHQSGMVGLTHLGFTLEQKERHLAYQLASHGYRCILSGVQHEASSYAELGYHECLGQDPNAVFADDFDPVSWDRANATAVATHLGSAEASTPWFISLGLFLPHRPFPDSPSGVPSVSYPPGLPDCEEVKEDYRRFCGAVAEMDRNVGTVLAALEESGMSKNTVVMIVTDHGIDFPRYKNSLSDNGLKVTLMIRLPGQKERRVYTSPVSLIDVYPTLLELLKLPQPGDGWHSDAQCIPELCPEAGHEHRRYAFGEINYHVSYQPERAVMDGRYLLLRRYHDHSVVLPNIGDSPTKEAVYRQYPASTCGGGPWSLYDRWYDPLQNQNIYEMTELTPIVHELQAALRDWMTATGDPLLIGEVPIPDGGVAAGPHLYSSHSADQLLPERIS
jgi:arylsulfatase A-like enzyme